MLKIFTVDICVIAVSANIDHNKKDEKDIMKFSTFTRNSDDSVFYVLDKCIDKMNHEIFTELYNEGFFKDKADFTKVHKKVFTVVISEDELEYILDINYARKKTKYIQNLLTNKDINKDGYCIDDTGGKAYVLTGFGQENLLYDRTIN